MTAGRKLKPRAPESTPPDLLACALAYAARGWRVLPVHTMAGGSCSCGGQAGCKAAKHARIADWQHAASADPAQITAWWTKWPGANIGLLASPGTFAALDVDPRNGGDVTLAALVAQHGPLPKTLVQNTGGGGQHILFAPGSLPHRIGAAPGLDMKGGGYILAAPSLHASGKRYSWANGGPESCPELPAAPKWLAEVGNSDGKHPMGAMFPPGERNDHLFRLACGRRREDQSEDDLLEEMRAENEARCDPPLPDAEVAQMVRQAMKYEPPDPLITAHLTDHGNAERLAAFARDRLRYIHPWKTWLTWDGGRWVRSENGQHMGIAKDLIAALYARAPQVKDDRREAFVKNALALESARRCAAMLESARDLLAVPAEDLDAQPHLLNVRNGTLDHSVDPPAFRAARREDYLTQQAAVNFEPGADCPTWVTGLQLIFNNSRELIAFFQRALGYALTGYTDAECFFVLHGKAAAGKTTLVEAARHLLGDYAESARVDTFLQSHNRDPDAEGLAALRAKRMVSTGEPEPTKALAEGLLKWATGGDTIRARAMYQSSFTYRPQWKLFLACNKLPRVWGTDDGIWRRIMPIPFDVTIPAEQRIAKSDLMERFEAEGPGILNWMLAGLANYRERGLAPPTAVQDDRAQYRSSQDALGQWLSDRTTTQGAVRVSNAALRADYEGWCRDVGMKPLGASWWREELASRGFDRVKNRGVFEWVGVGLLMEPEGQF